MTEHSHSRIRKLLDEVDTVVSAAESNGAFESHHERELDGFLDGLGENFEGHAAYEESELFERLRPKLDDEGLEYLERAIEQHEEFAETLGRAVREFDRLEPGTPADTPAFVALAEAISELDELWGRHDEVERKVLRCAGRDGAH